MRLVHAAQDRASVWLSTGLGRITDLAWPGSDALHDPMLEPELFALEEHGQIVAGCAVLTKEIEHRGRAWRASGLSAVVTDPGCRGRGYASTVASAARRWIFAENGADVGLFTCDRATVRVYVRAGWSVLEGTVLIGGTPDAPFRSDQQGFDKVVLAAWPDGREKAVRDAFSRTTVELYPGEVDRLW